MKKIISLFMALLMFLTIFSVSLIPASAAEAVQVFYQAHSQDYGWLGTVKNGATAGTTGKSKRMEAIQISIFGENGGVSYSTHVSDIGWMGTVSNGRTGGTTGKCKQIEAIKIWLTGTIASKYDIQYRVHMADIGWGSWVKNGSVAGTTGQCRRVEAIQIKLVKKTSSGTSTTTVSGYTQKVNAFLADSRFKNGASWSAKKTPVLTNYSSSGCCAYAADFVKYVFGKNNPRSGTAFYNVNEIRAGDVIYVTGSSHWFVVISRTGNSLKTAEGNWGGKVVVSDGTYTIVNNRLYRKGSPFRTFSTGYHYQ